MKVISREAEVSLIETLSDIEHEAGNWVGICFAFARLQEHYKSDYQIKIAINLIQDIIGQYEAMLYRCDDTTIFLLLNHTSKAMIDKLVFQLRYLFMDDPLAYDEEGEENRDFARIYDLSRSIEDFRTICKARLSSKIKGKSGKQGAAGKEAAATKAPVKKTAKADDSGVMNAAKLAHIERDLSNADLSRVLRQQPICAAVPDTMVRQVFDEIYINIGHLRRVLGVEENLASNLWLFKYMTQVLDLRMLHLLKNNPSRYLDNPISLNLNIQTLLSDEFAAFDASIKQAIKFSIVIEIQLADVFSDMVAFLAAKEHAQNLGYRVCLDGVTELSFTQIDRRKLGFDLLKLQWNADINADIGKEGSQELAAAIKSCGANRVILTRCDNRAAIDYGQGMGISLFQGRYLDSLINPKSTIEN